MNCDHCGKPVKLNAKFCGKCGAFLNFAKKIQAESQATQSLVTEEIKALLNLPEVPVNEQQIQAVSEQGSEQGSEQVSEAVDSVGHSDQTEHNHNVHGTEQFQEDLSDTHPVSPVEHEHPTQALAQMVTTESVQPEIQNELVHAAPSVAEPVHEQAHEPINERINVPDEEQIHALGVQAHAANESVNIEQLAPILNNSIPHFNAEFGANLDALRLAIESMRSEMDSKVADIKGDVHATAQALAQRIQLVQGGSVNVDMQGFNAGIEQLRGEIAAHFGELKAFWATSAQSLVTKNSDDLQSILSAEFKKIQTGIVNLYNTQQNNIVKSTSSFDEVVAALTFKIQNIENFVNSQLASQAQAQSAAQTANRSISTAVNEIRAQLQTQQELLSGLTIDPALIKTMNSFNINFRKQQEQLAAAKAQEATPAKTKPSDSGSKSENIVMWFVGFLCGLTILLGGFSIYNYYSAQDVKAELHKKKVEESLKLKDKSEKEELGEKEAKKSEGEESAKSAVKEESKSESESHSSEKGKEPEKKDADKKEADKREGEKSKETEKGSERSKEKSSSKSSEREKDKSDEKVSEKSSSKKHSSSEKE